MYAVARSFGVDPATAEDLVQTAWLRLVERVGQLRDLDALGAWLCTIVRNEARRYLVRRREVPAKLDLDWRSDGADPADAGLVRDLTTLHVKGFTFEPGGPVIDGLARVTGTSYAGPYVGALIAEQMSASGSDAAAAWDAIAGSGVPCALALGGGVAVALPSLEATATTPAAPDQPSR